jgi:hypothetical protein
MHGIKEKFIVYTILVGTPEGRDDLQCLDVHGRIILKCILSRVGGSELDCLTLERDRWRGYCDHGN